MWEWTPPPPHPGGQISILGKQNSPLECGEFAQSRWVHTKSEIQGEVVTEEDEEEEEAWPPGKMEDRALGGEELVVRERREELMPTAQQRPPPPLRAERSTGKELRSRGPRGGGVQVQGDCQCLLFNSCTTPSEYTYTSVWNNNCTPTSPFTPQH